MNDFYPVLTKT